MGRIYRWARRAWSRLHDWYLRIDTTEPALPGDKTWRIRADERINVKSQFRDSMVFGSPDYFYIYKIANCIRNLGWGDGTFYDIGCGKGRIICVMARYGFKRVVGVELGEDLCLAARANAATLRGRQAPIDVICDDVLRVPIDDGTVYCLFNPFGEKTMQAFHEKLKDSVARHPRDVLIVYYNPVHEEIFSGAPWLRPVHAFTTMIGKKRAVFFSSAAPDGPRLAA